MPVGSQEEQILGLDSPTVSQSVGLRIEKRLDHLLMFISFLLVHLAMQRL